MDSIVFNEQNLDYFNSLFNNLNDFQTLLESIPISTRYITNGSAMLCSYYDDPQIPTWNDYRVLKGFETIGYIKDRESKNRSFYEIDSYWGGNTYHVTDTEEIIETRKKLNILIRDNPFTRELYHRPIGARYSYELKIINQLLPPEMYDEIKILFSKHCILPIREEEIDGKKHYCFFKTTGDNYGITTGLGYIGIFYIFSTDKDFIKKSTVEGILYKLLTDTEHTRMPEEVNEELITKIANLDYDLDSMKLDRLKLIIKSSFDKIKSVTLKRIGDFTVYANDYLERYRKTLVDIDNENERLKTLLNKTDKSTEEMLNVLLKYQHKNIILDISDKNVLSNNNSKINIMLRTPLFNYNEDILNKMLKSPDRYGIDKDSFFYILLKNTLKDGCNYEIIFTTPIAIDIANGSTQIDTFRIGGTTSRDSNEAARRCMSGLPNPHLGFYNCWGQNAPELIKLLNKNKFEEYMIALIATAGNLNLSDTTVVDRFKNLVNNIGASNKVIKFIKNKTTNELLSKAEFLKEIEDNENN